MIYMLIISMLTGALAFNKPVCKYQQQYDLDIDEEILDQASHFNSTDAVLTTKNILLLDQYLNVVNRIRTPTNGSHKCDLVLGHQTLDMFFVVCQTDAGKPYIAAFKPVANSTSYEQFGVYNYLAVNQTIKKIELIGNTLLIQTSDQILFYTVVIQVSEWYIRTTSYVLDKAFFERSSLYIEDFTFAPYYQDLQQYYRIFVVDYSDGILLVDAILKTNNLIPYNKGFLYLNQTYPLSRYSKFRRAVIVKMTQNTTQFVIQTYNNESYYYGAQFSSTYSPQLQHHESLDNYNQWQAILNIQMDLSLFPFQNSQKTVVTNIFKINPDQIAKPDNELGQKPTDILISAAIDKFVFYYSQGDNLVYKSDFNELTICQLSNYNEI